MKKITKLLMLLLFAASCTHGQTSQKEDPNSVILSKNGKNYQLTAVGDRIPTFLVDGQSIPKERFEEYEPLFSELQNQLEEKKQKHAQRVRVLSDQIQANLVEDLLKDKLINTTTELKSFRLDSRSFSINGKGQSFEVFSRYKNKYLNNDNSIIQFN